MSAHWPIRGRMVSSEPRLDTPDQRAVVSTLLTKMVFLSRRDLARAARRSANATPAERREVEEVRQFLADMVRMFS